jgi:hypothetical protein
MSQDFGHLDDNKVEELRAQMREVVSGVKDPSGSMLDVTLMSHSNHGSVHSNTGSPPPNGPPGPP